MSASALGFSAVLMGRIMGSACGKAKYASDHLDTLVIALLDEMNLAVVEHYFSDFLSVVETRRRENGEIVTDALPLDLPTAKSGDDDPYAALRALGLPPNFRVVGSANMDETTRLFSPKVLDRAFSITFDEVDLTTFADVSESVAASETDFSALATRLLRTDAAFVSEAYQQAEVLFDRAAALLEEIRQILRPGGVSLGYRPRDQVVMYLYHWQADKLADVLDLNAAFDLCVLQKILPKISGTTTALGESLAALETWLKAERDDAEPGEITGPFLRSADKVTAMRQRLEAEGATSFWTS